MSTPSGSADSTEAAAVAASLEDFAAAVMGLQDLVPILERFALSSLGVRALRELVPRTADGARAALGRVREMCELASIGALPSLAGVSDPLPARDQGARSMDEDRFVALRAFLEACARIRAWFESCEEAVPELLSVATGIPDLEPLVAAIDRVLDARGRVRDDASALLERLHRERTELERRVERVLKELLQRPDVRNVLSDGSVHRRAGRPVLAVKAKSAGRVRGIVHDRSQSEQSVFIEPLEAIELGNRAAELNADERRERDRILLELARHVLDAEPAIRHAASCVSEIELAMISARYAERHDARPALLPGEPGASEALLLRGARHPLLVEQVENGSISDVVPIDLRLGADFDMLVITGPNTGGKTLALKTAGLFALMTRMGLPVPASEGTTVPLYRRVIADIGDEQEISQNLSTFASHLVRIRQGLACADERTLVLLDELGGGTDPDEGAALGEAVLEFLGQRRVPTLVSTHLGQLKEFAFRRTRVENACAEFDLETLEPLYRLLVGVPGESGALVIARRLGLPDEVVDRAEQRMIRRDDELGELMDEVRHARVAAERVRTDAEQELEQVQQTTRDLRAKRDELDRRGELLELEAQRGLEERVRNAMRRLADARALLSQLPREVAEAMQERLDALAADLSGASLTERRRSFLGELAKGNLVYLPRYRQRVLVKKVDHQRREVTVKLGSMNMKVPFDEVTWYESL